MGELLMLGASAQARISGDFDVPGLFSDARVYVYSAAVAALEAELLTRESYAFLMVGDQDTAENRSISVLEMRASLGEPSYVSPIQHSRARAHDLLAFIYARREEYANQKRHLRSGLEECDETPVRDIVFEANLLSNLAIFSVDFGDDGYVRERLNYLPDFSWIAPQRYEIVRSLGWSNALRGDNLGAFRDLRDASDIAHTVPRRMRATLDRAYFARMLSQTLTAREELDYAERLSNRVNWNDAASDEGELTALLHLSQELASTVPLRARRFFEKYRALKPKLPPNILATADRRAWAEELVADATIANAEGSVGRALCLFTEAFEIWDSLGYSVRAALAARELAILGAGDFFAEYSSREASIRPRSWLAVSLATPARR